MRPHIEFDASSTSSTVRTRSRVASGAISSRSAPWPLASIAGGASMNSARRRYGTAADSLASSPPTSRSKASSAGLMTNWPRLAHATSLKRLRSLSP